MRKFAPVSRERECEERERGWEAGPKMGKTVETKRKKKGRPSLLDLQKRSLRLQQQQQKRNPNPNPNSNSNPYLRFPNTGGGTGRRSTRRNPIIEPVAEVHDDGEEDDGNIGKRREKKLKLVLRIDDHSENSLRHSGSSGSESEGQGSGARRKRKIEAVGGGGDRLKVDRHSSLKTTESLRAFIVFDNPTDLDEIFLLNFRKDTYGVFSEPVDPEELPDYHEVIEYPMDFSTVRKKLSSGAYKNLEQFEKDVFLISSNAMRYNATDTIYYRQARSIQDLAKKNFENLRQESDKEPEMKTVVRRGRPPSKNISRPVGPPPSELAASGFSSDPTLTNAGGSANLFNQSHPLLKKGPATDKPGSADVSGKVLYGLRNSDSFGWINTNKVDAREEFPGSAKGLTSRFGKKVPVMEENRRNTYSQFQPYSYGCELPIWSLFDGEKKQLAAVGLHMEYAYARSLARFAAHLGSLGWAIASKKIEKALPPGTKFGRGWVGDDEILQKSQLQFQSSSPSNQSSQATLSPCTTILKGNNKPSQKVEPSCRNMSSEGIGKSTTMTSAAPCDVGSSNHGETNHNETGILSKPPFQVNQNRGMQPIVNGFTSGFRFNLPSQAANMMKPMRPPMSFGSEPPMTHARALDMAPRNTNGNTLIRTHSSHFDSEMALTCNTPPSFGKPMPDHGNDSQWRTSSMQAKLESIPPDLNIRFQSPGSPVSAAGVDAQQPDLALQL
ncbi:hypothetical protein IEQ34_022096 [Dendrobium chrysotoxum]|uniref:Bromo domain-containing protein n=1 Tax=Dendrobium chrysotoxum TaxID=161865 RepID=A0AAV7FWU7_DENCH|nr:hypothetical protein IEQ34_022096 [Dendrobium chrysotoxum]